MTAEKLSITLPSDMAQAVRDFVAAGSYASNSEVIRDALRLWLTREEEQEHRLAEIKAQIAAAIASPIRVSASEVDRRLESLYAKILKD